MKIVKYLVETLLIFPAKRSTSQCHRRKLAIVQSSAGLHSLLRSRLLCGLLRLCALRPREDHRATKRCDGDESARRFDETAEDMQSYGSKRAATRRVLTKWKQEPEFFCDLNLGIVDAVTAGREQYRLKPFFYEWLTDLPAVTYRHEVCMISKTSNSSRASNRFQARCA